MKTDWMKEGVVAIYNNPQTGNHGKKCIINSEPYTRDGRIILDTTLFKGGEYAHLFIPDGFKTVAIPVDLLIKHKEAIEYARNTTAEKDTVFGPSLSPRSAFLALVALADALEVGDE